MNQPDDPGQSIVHHHHSNGANRIVWGAASVFGLLLIAISSVALAKVYEMAERLVKVETTLEILVKQK